MNIVFASDRGYLPHLSAAIASLLDTNSSVALNIYIINSDISSDEWLNLTKLDTKKKHTFINAQIKDEELTDLVTSYHFTKANYYRLFIDEVVPFDKALYIDSDVVVNGDLAELWNVNVSDFFLAAVEEPNFFRHEELEMSLDSRCFNSGVMLINLKKWRNDSIRNKVLDFVRRKPESIKFVDQCGLNAVINGAWLQLSPKFNMQTAILEMNHEDVQRIYNFNNSQDALKTPAIIHYTGSVKPWHLLSTHQFKSKYWHYLNQTHYKRLLPADLTLKKLIIWCFPIKYRALLIRRISAIRCSIKGVNKKK